MWPITPHHQDLRGSININHKIATVRSQARPYTNHHAQNSRSCHTTYQQRLMVTPFAPEMSSLQPIFVREKKGELFVPSLSLKDACTYPDMIHDQSFWDTNITSAHVLHWSLVWGTCFRLWCHLHQAKCTRSDLDSSCTKLFHHQHTSQLQYLYLKVQSTDWPICNCLYFLFFEACSSTLITD